jgi:uncharacterized protein (TIGR02611 family)
MFRRMNIKGFFEKIKQALKMEGYPSGVRRAVVGVVGGTVVVIGIVLIVLPGPAFVVIPIGLAILASEFAWARLYMTKGRKMIKTVKSKVRRAKPAAS